MRGIQPRSFALRMLRRMAGRLAHGVRAHRARRFLETMRPQPGETILDVGSGPGGFWSEHLSPEALRGVRVVACDMLAQPVSARVDAFFVADARRLPLRDGSVDIVFSNSVLEHVGGPREQRNYVEEIRRVGRRYFIQAPDRDFPLEPHYFVPFLQRMPVPWQRAITRCLFAEDEEIHLPDERTLRELFPDASMERERIAGLSKCFYVFGVGAQAAPLPTYADRRPDDRADAETAVREIGRRQPPFGSR